MAVVHGTLIVVWMGKRRTMSPAKSLRELTCSNRSSTHRQRYLGISSIQSLSATPCISWRYGGHQCHHPDDPFQDPEHTHSSANGLYTIGTNGRGLKKLVSSPDPSLWAFNVSSQYTWSNFSRNGTYYVDGLSYGSFSGGPLTSYGSPLHDDVLVGWTTK